MVALTPLKYITRLENIFSLDKKNVPPKFPEQPSDSAELLLVWHVLCPVQPDVHVHVAAHVPKPVERGPEYEYATIILRSVCK